MPHVNWSDADPDNSGIALARRVVDDHRRDQSEDNHIRLGDIIAMRYAAMSEMRSVCNERTGRFVQLLQRLLNRLSCQTSRTKMRLVLGLPLFCVDGWTPWSDHAM